MGEPEIIINGQRLTSAQAMTLRVAISSFDPHCGYDDHGVAMAKSYAKHARDIFRIMASETI